MTKSEKSLYLTFVVFTTLLVLTSNKGFSQNVRDISGFRNTTWNMGVVEVSDSLESNGMNVEKASSPSNAENTGYENIPDSLKKMVDKATLKVENYQISNLNYEVEFYFSEDQITLSKVEVSKEDGTSASFETLSEILTKKYGKPTSTSKNSRPIGKFGISTKEKTWVYPTTTINLQYYSGGQSPDVSGDTSIIYEPTEGESTDKI
jgi:hypothetical protein